MESNSKSENRRVAGGLISLSAWRDQIGVSDVTAWRWRREGWLKTVNICGRQYLTRQAAEDFLARAESGEFAKEHKVPAKKGAAA